MVLGLVLAASLATAAPVDSELRDRARFRFGVGAGGTVTSLGFGLGLSLDLGVQLNDLLAVYVHGGADGLPFSGSALASVMAEVSLARFTLAVGVGPAGAFTVLDGTRSFGGVAVPFILGVTFGDRADAVRRRGVHLALEGGVGIPIQGFLVPVSYVQKPLAFVGLRIGFVLR